MSRVDDQAADLRGSGVVVAHRKDLVAKVAINARRVMLAPAHFVIDVGRLVGSMLCDDQARSHQLADLRIFKNEQVAALERLLDLAVEASYGFFDQGLQHFLLVRQIHRVELRSESLQSDQVALLDIAQQEHGSVGSYWHRRAINAR